MTTSRAGARTFLDLATGATTQSPAGVAVSWGKSANGRYSISRTQNTTNEFDVDDAVRAQTIGRITAPAGSASGGGSVSNDGRYVAAGYFTSAAPPYRYVIGVWDLGGASNRAMPTQPAPPGSTP